MTMLPGLDEWITGQWGEDALTPQPQECALADCSAEGRFLCVCCNRLVCAFDIAGGLCIDCVCECVGGCACQVVM